MNYYNTFMQKNVIKKMKKYIIKRLNMKENFLKEKFYMRKLIILRGISGCGKSTFVKTHKLEQYTLSPDNLRLMFTGETLDINGNYQISQEKNSRVFTLLYEILESRMEDGAFTVVDSTNLTKDDFVKYKKLAKKYRYQLYCINFTDIPFETILRQNKQRESYKIVPEYVLLKMKDRLQNSIIPSGITILKPDEFEKVFVTPIDLSSYKKIHHFGDIHGCYTALHEYFEKYGELNDDDFYIFCGDYIDRGIENTEVLRFLSSIKDKQNVQLLQGNHEIHLMKYAHGETTKSLEFNENTVKDFETKGLTKREISALTKKFTQCAYYTYHGKTLIVTHGGLSTIPQNLAFVNTLQMIKGVGKYSEYSNVAKTFYESTDDNVYQINGHRNVLHLPIEVKENDKNLRCFNLEGGVEQGGCLRIVTLDENGFTPIEIKNTVFKEQNDQLLFDMRHNTLIKEKVFDEISSFNFTRDAFTKGIWNDQTIKARGLYLNNETGKVICRGYEKFFAIDERPESSIGFIKNNWTFPLTAYVKENGYLGLVSYREKTDELFITTKSDPTKDYALWLKDKIMKYDIDKLKKYVKENNCTFVFEHIDMEHDPHIIKYPSSKLVLLDIIENTVDEFKRKSYEELVTIAKQFGFEVKEKAFTFQTFDEFILWYKNAITKNYQYNGKYIEGFVIEDKENHMCKLKTQYYKCWKYLRGRVETIKKRQLTYDQVKCGMNVINYTEMNLFLKWFCENQENIDSNRIIEIRDLYHS